jgi:hypothetical protein
MQETVNLAPAATLDEGHGFSLVIPRLPQLLRKGTASAVPNRQPNKDGFSHWGMLFWGITSQTRERTFPSG